MTKHFLYTSVSAPLPTSQGEYTEEPSETLTTTFRGTVAVRTPYITIMCNTTVLQGRSASHVENVVIMRQEETARSVLGCKRARSTSTTPCDETSRVRRRPHKRVSFSNRDLVLGHAQEYDRSTAPDPVPLATRVRAQLIARRNYLMKTSKAIEGSDSDSPVTSASRGKANFCGIWRRSHGFNWAALLELSGVDKVAIPEQVGFVLVLSEVCGKCFFTVFVLVCV